MCVMDGIFLTLFTGWNQWLSLAFIESKLPNYSHGQIEEALALALKNGWVKKDQNGDYMMTEAGIEEWDKINPPTEERNIK